jgi:topoisomerase-4 subunit B
MPLDGSDYSAKDIDVLEGLQPVRAKPGMYIGATDWSGLYQIAKEVIDNSIDEALAGHNTVVGLLLDGPEHYIWDNGRGIPVEKHHKIQTYT